MPEQGSHSDKLVRHFRQILLWPLQLMPIRAGSQIKGSRTEIFEESEGGNHFMFMENPEKFNRIVKEFIG